MEQHPSKAGELENSAVKDLSGVRYHPILQVVILRKNNRKSSTAMHWRDDNDVHSVFSARAFSGLIGYQGSAVLDETEREAGTTSVPIPQGEDSENTPLPDLPEQPENVQRPGSEVVEKGMLT